MHTPNNARWLRAWLEAWYMNAEALLVIAMRLNRIAAAGATGAAERRLMVAEKIQAGLELQAKVLSGGFGRTPLSHTQGVLKHYGRKVTANRKRLLK